MTVNFLWSVNDIFIPDITSNTWSGQQMWTHGTALIRRRGAERDEFVSWDATITNLGWYVKLSNENHRIGEYQGDTFVLPLEIYAAINRLF